MLDGEPGRGSPRVNAELAVGRAEMLTHGARADIQLGADLGIGQPVSDEPEHVELTHGEPSRERHHGDLRAGGFNEGIDSTQGRLRAMLSENLPRFVDKRVYARPAIDEVNTRQPFEAERTLERASASTGEFQGTVQL